MQTLFPLNTLNGRMKSTNVGVKRESPMNPIPPKDDVAAKVSLLDMAYQKLTGFQFKLRGVVTGREQAWHAFIQAGFTLEDLDTVLTWLNRRIREGKRDTGSRRFSTLIANLDRFDEELSMAKAEKRNVRPPVTPKERVIEQARPTVGEQTKAEVNARNAQDVALAALRAMKKELFGTDQ